MRKYKVAIAGATGVVGREMMKVLEERNFPVGELIPLAEQAEKLKESSADRVHARTISGAVTCDLDNPFARDVHIDTVSGSITVRVPEDADGLYRSRCIPGLWLDPRALLAYNGPALIAALEQGLATAEHAAFVARLAGQAARVAGGNQVQSYSSD